MGCGSSDARKPAVEVTTEPTLYYWPGSAPCRAVLMTASAASVHIDTRIVDVFGKDDKQQAELKKVNPEKTLPMLVDGKKTIHDSHEIMKYLVKKYAKKQRLYPENDKKAGVDELMAYDKKVVFPAITGWLYPQVFQQKDPDPNKEKVVVRCLDRLDTILTDQPFVASSHVTLPDFSLVTSLSLLEVKDYNLVRWTRVQAWLQHMRDLPYYASSNIGIEEWKFALQLGDQSAEQTKSR